MQSTQNSTLTLVESGEVAGLYSVQVDGKHQGWIASPAILGVRVNQVPYYKLSGALGEVPDTAHGPYFPFVGEEESLPHELRATASRALRRLEFEVGLEGFLREYLSRHPWCYSSLGPILAGDKYLRHQMWRGYQGGLISSGSAPEDEALMTGRVKRRADTAAWQNQGWDDTTPYPERDSLPSEWEWLDERRMPQI